MKKLILIAVIQLVCMTGFAQTFSFGGKAGANFSTISGVDDASTKTGLVAGVFGVYSIMETFGVSADLLYSQEGAKGKTGDPMNGTTTLKLNYLRIPVLANVFFGEQGNTFRPKISLGPSMGFLLAAKSGSTDVKNQFGGFDLSGVIGAGFNYRMAEMTWLNVDLRYSIGATDIRKNKPAGDAYKNNVFSITLGIAFGE